MSNHCFFHASQSSAEPTCITLRDMVDERGTITPVVEIRIGDTVIDLFPGSWERLTIDGSTVKGSLFPGPRRPVLRATALVSDAHREKRIVDGDVVLCIPTNAPVTTPTSCWEVLPGGNLRCGAVIAQRGAGLSVCLDALGVPITRRRFKDEADPNVAAQMLELWVDTLDQLGANFDTEDVR